MTSSQALNHQNQLYTTLLSELRKGLTEAQITQAQIGETLGIKQSAVSSLLSGKSRMSLDQFILLSDLVGVRPQNLLQNVQNQLTQVVPMSPEVENTLYKSALHTIAYCMAVREISVKDFTLHNISNENIHGALEDLVKVGLLIKKKEKFIQKNPQTIFRASSRFKGSKIHQDIVQRSWEVFDRNYANKAFIATKFNSYLMDRFTVSQTKEIEAALWKVFEKVQAFRQANLANGYRGDESMPLWNIHLMLNTPLEPKS
jgi:predicted transcriptional regulator